MLLLLASMAHADKPDIVWTGVDFGLVHLIGTRDFRDPDAIFPGYLNRWNGLYIDEMMPVLRKRLKANIGSSTSHLGDLHAAADPDHQIVRDDLISPDEAFLSPDDVARRVREYQPTAEQGLGVVFVADQLNKPAQQGCYWVTFWDIGQREIVQTTYRCGDAQGFGFRNYWFGTIKNVTERLRRSDMPR